MTTQQEKINMTDLVKGKQLTILAKYFDKHIGQMVSKRTLEKIFALECALYDLTDEDILKCVSKEELISKAGDVPGDVQRQLRTLHDKIAKYGLIKYENEPLNQNCKVCYQWNPIDKSKVEHIIPPSARNIFKTKQESDQFIANHNATCECCGANLKDEKTLRMAVDHWRAHSIYDIDDKGIAVLLCETCNNIHHNHDASFIALKYKDNLGVINKWKKIELRIRQNGFLPNEEDSATQKENIEKINQYWNDELNHPLGVDFWEGLF